VIFKLLPQWVNLQFLQPYGFATLVKQKDGITMLYEIPFLDRMGFVFIICVIGMYLISMYENRKGVKPHGLEVDTRMFKMSPGFAAGALIVCGILTALYTIYW